MNEWTGHKLALFVAYHYKVKVMSLAGGNDWIQLEKFDNKYKQTLVKNISKDMQEKTFRLGEYIWLLQSTSGNHFDSLLPKNNNEYVISTLYILFYIILFIVTIPILFFFVSLTY